MVFILEAFAKDVLNNHSKVNGLDQKRSVTIDRQYIYIKAVSQEEQGLPNTEKKTTIISIKDFRYTKKDI